MNRMAIVVPRASWSDIFSEDPENPLIPGAPHSKRLPKEPAAMHLPCLSFLSKEWGEVHLGQMKSDDVAPRTGAWIET